MSENPDPFVNRTEDTPAVTPGVLLNATWQCPSNIAIIKYWGKKNGQFPANPSLSMTLDQAYTQTKVSVVPGDKGNGLLSLNGDADHPFLPKMRHLLNCIREEVSALRGVSLEAHTANNFPHSTGIASSASGIGAFALCLVDLGYQLAGETPRRNDFMSAASRFARMGSGSACRSLYSGFTVWGATPWITGSSDEYAIPAPGLIHPEMMQIKDAILVISTKPKELPSSGGHQLMKGHPFLGGRILQADKNLEEALSALVENDFEKLGNIAENEALTLHALIMSAIPGTILLKPSTLEVIHLIRETRHAGIPVFFTLDAGANVHVLYPGHSAQMVEKFIGDALQPFCENGLVIYDHCGSGPMKVNGNQPPG